MRCCGLRGLEELSTGKQHGETDICSAMPVCVYPLATDYSLLHHEVGERGMAGQWNMCPI